MNSATLLYVIAVPLVAGIITFILPKRMSALIKLIALIAVGVTCYFAVTLYGNQPVSFMGAEYLGIEATGHPWLKLDALSGFILLGVAFFSACMLLYSLGFVRDEETSPRSYYSYFLWCVAASCGIAVSGNLIVLLIFWGFLGIPFYLLINLGSEKADVAAKKTLIILGATDSLLILGVAAIYMLRGNFDMAGPKVLIAGDPVALLAFLCLMAAAFAKAGGMPFHSWVPDAAESAPVPAVAFMPASLDKLLGIYFLARMCLYLFELNEAMRILVLVLGAITVIAAVMMALIQHNLRRLLGFHAVSQVGYMILGIGTGTPIGIIGGLFHMLNNAIYKSALFLCAGAAERRSRETDLAKMGGLARSMPITFLVAVVSALAISGVPPLNGFVSKWMVYQGIIETGSGGGYLWVFLLVAAMFGSALTLASFVKVLHSVFLGQASGGRAEAGDGPTPGPLMGIPMVVLGLLCVVFGVFAFSVPIAKLILPALPDVGAGFNVARQSGLWAPTLATILILLGLLIGVVILVIGKAGTAREAKPFIGGETGESRDQFRFAGTDFYGTVRKVSPLTTLYRHAEEKWYDIYDLGSRLTFYISDGLKALHSGLLLTYVSWCVLGLVVLLWVFLGKG